MPSPDALSVSSGGTSVISLSGSIEPTRLSALYRVSLVAVAAAMLLLPLLYLLLVAGAVAAVWWHLSANVWLMTGTGAAQVRLLAYVAPAIIGVAMVFFMIKPVLARPGKRQDPVPILPADEPVLFEFIEQLCRQIGAPFPQRVQIDCQVNASASFPPGWLAIFRRNLVLTVGLPLVAGLSVRELGGVLAHELGHFAQGGGMRLTAVVRGINNWFGRVVYERDHWDEKLATWSKDSDFRIGIVLGLARGFIWITRRLLYGLMLVGHAISCFMMRQMEYDADSYEIKFAGTQAFARTFFRMRELGVVMQLGYQDLRHAWQLRALPDDFAAFLIDRRGRLPEEVVTQLRSLPDQRTSPFDTHPSPADRIKAAEAAAAAGVLVGGDVPATLLFRNFGALSAAATRHHYEHDLGIELEGVALVPAQDVVDAGRRREQGLEVVAAFFGESVSWYRPLRLPVDEIVKLGDAELQQMLAAARATMATLARDLPARYRRFEWLAMRRDKAFAAGELLTAGLSIGDVETLEVAEPTLEGASATEAWAVEQQQLEVPFLDRFEAAAGQRLACGLLLASRKSTSPAMRPLWVLFNATSGILPDMSDAQRFGAAAALLKRRGETHDTPEAVTGRVALLIARVEDRLQKARQGLGDLACPPELGGGPLTAATRCGLEGPAGAALSDVIERTVSLYWDLLRTVVTTAQRGENAEGSTSA